MRRKADGYDDFRKRLLKGREEMYGAIPLPKDGVWIDMGGGTGSNLEFLGDSIAELKKIYVVDLATSLLEVSQKRFDKNGWNNAEAIEADATTFRPPEEQVDVITFSYSLSMIPDWFGAIENALQLLKPGGIIGAVDFYVARKYPADGLKRHRWFTRHFWPTWFASDNVFLSPDHIPFFTSSF